MANSKGTGSASQLSSTRARDRHGDRAARRTSRSARGALLPEANRRTLVWIVALIALAVIAYLLFKLLVFILALVLTVVMVLVAVWLYRHWRSYA